MDTVTAHRLGPVGQPGHRRTRRTDLTTRPHPEHAYRACLGLINLAKRYGNDRVGAACQRALATGAVSYTSVKSILTAGLDQVPLTPPAPTPPPPTHANLRGPDYYTGPDDDPAVGGDIGVGRDIGVGGNVGELDLDLDERGA